jgi:hypothetical protein
MEALEKIRAVCNARGTKALFINHTRGVDGAAVDKTAILVTTDTFGCGGFYAACH